MGEQLIWLRKYDKLTGSSNLSDKIRTIFYVASYQRARKEERREDEVLSSADRALQRRCPLGQSQKVLTNADAKVYDLDALKQTAWLQVNELLFIYLTLFELFKDNVKSNGSISLRTNYTGFYV